jgi:hypothetical protein
MKKIWIMALCAMMATMTINSSFANTTEPCKKECCKDKQKCDKKDCCPKECDKKSRCEKQSKA